MTTDSSTLMREAHALRAAGRLNEAAGRYSAALRANPSAIAEHNLAGALGDLGRWVEAERHIAAALAKGLDAPETLMLKARCELALAGTDGGRLDAAETALREALRRAPGWREAQRMLAELVWMRTGDVGLALAGVDDAMIRAQALEAAGDVEQALAAVSALADQGGRDAHVLAEAARLAGLAGRPQAALTMAVQARAVAPHELDVQIAQVEQALAAVSALVDQDGRDAHVLAEAARLAGLAGRPHAALTLAVQARAVAPHELDVQIAQVEALLGVGDAARGAELAGDIRRKWSTDQRAIALQAAAWRMLGDPRRDELSDLDELVSVGSAGGDAPNMAGTLKALHHFRAQPFRSPVRGGGVVAGVEQRAGLGALPASLDRLVSAMTATLRDADDPVRSRNRGTHVIARITSVRVGAGGGALDHVRADGWISGLCLVEGAADVRLGRARIAGLEAEFSVTLAPGTTILFPSYMWCGLEAERGAAWVEFDVVPGTLVSMNDEADHDGVG